MKLFLIYKNCYLLVIRILYSICVCLIQFDAKLISTGGTTEKPDQFDRVFCFLILFVF